MDFRIWGRITQSAPAHFFIVASAVPEAAEERPIVLTASAPSLSAANAERERLMVESGAAVHGRGDRVVDVEGQ